MTKTITAFSALLLLFCLSASAHPNYPDMRDIAGPYSFRLGTGGIGAYLAPRGVDYTAPIDRGGMPPNSTQVFVANFRPGTFFSSFPGEHVALILWGSPAILPLGNHPNFGRGVALGAVPGCKGISIEQFHSGTILEGSCRKVDFQPTMNYELIIHVSAGWVYYRLSNAGNGKILAEHAMPVPDANPDAGRRDIIIGHTADDRMAGQVGYFELFNVYDGYYLNPDAAKAGPRRGSRK